MLFITILNNQGQVRQTINSGETNDNCGFTLIELIIVIAILGILAAIAVTRLSGYSDVAEKAVCNSSCKDIEK